MVTRASSTGTNVAKISQIKGVPPGCIEELGRLGIETVDDLFRAGGNREGRLKLAGLTSLSEVQIVNLVNAADLFSIKAITGEYAELLESIGIDTLESLAYRAPEPLQKQLILANWKHNIVPIAPDLKSISLWITRAKLLVRRINPRVR